MGLKILELLKIKMMSEISKFKKGKFYKSPYKAVVDIYSVRELERFLKLNPSVKPEDIRIITKENSIIYQEGFLAIIMYKAYEHFKVPEQPLKPFTSKWWYLMYQMSNYVFNNTMFSDKYQYIAIYCLQRYYNAIDKIERENLIKTLKKS